MPTSSICRKLALAIFAIAWPACGRANNSLSRYVEKTWTEKDGLPAGPIYSITQTWDGYLWIGTEAGPVRFDGHEFQLRRTSTSGVPLGPALGLGTDRENGLWIMQRIPSTLRLQDEKTTEAARLFDTDFNSIRAISQLGRGRFLAFAVQRKDWRILEFDHPTPKSVAQFKKGLDSPVISMAQTAQGNLFLGTFDTGVCRVEGDHCLWMVKGLPDPKVNALLAARNNHLWVGTDNGLVQLDGNVFVRSGVPQSLVRERILALAEDTSGNVWIGTGSQGLMRLDPSGRIHNENAAGQETNAVPAIFEDREKNIWVVRPGGIEEITRRPFVTVPVGGDPTGGGAVYADRLGRIWCAPAKGGLQQLDAEGRVIRSAMRGTLVYSIAGDDHGIWAGDEHGQIHYLPFDQHARAREYRAGDNAVMGLGTSAEGAVWAGTLTEGAIAFQGHQKRQFKAGDGLGSNTINAIAFGADGSVWFATPLGVTRLLAGAWHSFPTGDEGRVNCMLVDRRGVLWIGGQSGLSYFQDEKIHTVDLAGFQGEVNGISEDDEDRLWLVTANDVLRVKRDDLLRRRVGTDSLIRFGAVQGLHSTQTARRSSPIARDGAGRLWIYFNDGLGMVEPSQLANDAIPINAAIESVEQDGVVGAPGALLQVETKTRRVRIRFIGLSLSDPDRVRFRYQLQPYDQEWSQPTQIREAIYMNLPAGRYHFAVEASLPGQAWKGERAELAIRVHPAYWETWTFRSLLLAAFLAAGMLGYRLRVRQVTNQLNIRFEERLNERTRIAQELHDTLLQGVVAASMQIFALADSLKANTTAQARASRVSGFLAELVEDGRRTIQGLKSPPVEVVDFAQSLAQVAQDLGLDQVRFRIVSHGIPRPIHPPIRDEVYRICCEAIANAFRHSGAEEIVAEILFADHLLRIKIRDNGCGMNSAVLQAGKQGHLGLSGMRQRADKTGARLHVWSSPGHGTEVELSMPADIAFSRPMNSAARTPRTTALKYFSSRKDRRI